MQAIELHTPELQYGKFDGQSEFAAHVDVHEPVDVSHQPVLQLVVLSHEVAQFPELQYGAADKQSELAVHEVVHRLVTELHLPVGPQLVLLLHVAEHTLELQYGKFVEQSEFDLHDDAHVFVVGSHQPEMQFVLLLHEDRSEEHTSELQSHSESRMPSSA